MLEPKNRKAKRIFFFLVLPVLLPGGLLLSLNMYFKNGAIQSVDAIEYRISNTIDHTLCDTIIKGTKYLFSFTTKFRMTGRNFIPAHAEIERDSLVGIELNANGCSTFRYELSKPEMPDSSGENVSKFDSFSEFVKFYNYQSFSGEVDVSVRELGAQGILFDFVIPRRVKCTDTLM